MDKVKSVITKILATWVGIGTALVALAVSGVIPVPELLINFFSGEAAALIGTVTDVILATIGSVITFAQAFRALLIGQETGEVSVRTLDSLKILRRSPFAV